MSLTPLPDPAARAVEKQFPISRTGGKNRREDAVQQRDRVRAAAAQETDPRICLWARVRLGGERPIDPARECGYADASGITQTVKRLEQRTHSDQKMAGQLALLRKMSKVND